MAPYVHPLQPTLVEPGLLVTEGYEIESLSVEGDTAVANMMIRSRIKHPLFSAKPREYRMPVRWVRYEGRWYKDVTPTGPSDIIKNYYGLWTSPTAEQATTEPEVQTQHSDTDR
jgi:hypothetical protein